MRTSVLVTTLLLVVCLLIACGGEPTPDPTVVAKMAEEAVKATIAAQPTATSLSTDTPNPPTETSSPAPTTTPINTPTGTATIPTPIELSAIDLRGFLETVQLPDEYELKSGVEREDMFAGIPDTTHEYIVDLHRDGDKSGFIGVFLYQDNDRTEQAMKELVAGFTSEDEMGLFESAILHIDDELGEVASGARFVTQIEPIADESVNFAWVDIAFVRCHSVNFVRLILSPRQNIYTGDEVFMITEEVIAYAQRLDEVLSSVVCVDSEAPNQISLDVPTSIPTKTSTPVSPTATPKSVSQQPKLGKSRSNPVPFRSSTRVSRWDGDAVFDIAVADVIRGATAQQMMNKANMFNGKPSDSDLEWILVRMKGTCLKADNDIGTSFGDPTDMRIYANDRRVSQPLGAISPEPELHGMYFEGAKLDGWIPFFVYKNDPSPLLFVEDNFLDAKKGAWFSLNSASQVTPQSTPGEPQAIVQGNRVNVRSGPGTNYSVVNTVAGSTQLTITGKNEEGTWWKVCCINNQDGWIADSVISIVGTTSAVPVNTEVVPSEKSSEPSSPASGQWELVADSISDYPNNQNNRKWWHLWSEGRFNFNWQEMSQQPGDCAKIPSSYSGFICADIAGADVQADVALQWKAPEGGKYLLEWSTQSTKGQGDIYLYKHLEEMYSVGPGLSLPNSVIVDNVDAWQMFFFVIRSHGDPYETKMHVRVYHWKT